MGVQLHKVWHLLFVTNTQYTHVFLLLYVYICISCIIVEHNYVWINIWLLQRREGRKHPADRAWSGQTGGLWFCLDCGACQLFCGDSLLVSVYLEPAVFFYITYIWSASRNAWCRFFLCRLLDHQEVHCHSWKLLQAYKWGKMTDKTCCNWTGNSLFCHMPDIFPDYAAL